MLYLLLPPAFLNLLRCPYDCQGSLTIMGEQACCQSCGREFGVSPEGVLEFVAESELDAATLQELHGHVFNLAPQQIDQLMRNERSVMWTSYYSRNRKKAIQHLASLLDRVNCEQVFFLGAGTGREIEYLLSFRKLHTVYCSDLSYTALRMIPARLAPYDLKLGLFTSDLQRCPVARKEVPLVIVNALHHTQDMHETLEALLAEQYDNLFVVEPTDNFLIRFLAKRGVARRREYSGVIPGRLNLPRLQEMCRRHGYALTFRTQWEFPRDYYMKIFGNPRRFQKLFFSLLNIFSVLSNTVSFGNFSIVRMAKINAGADGEDPTV